MVTFYSKQCDFFAAIIVLKSVESTFFVGKLYHARNLDFGLFLGSVIFIISSNSDVIHLTIYIYNKYNLGILNVLN